MRFIDIEGKTPVNTPADPEFSWWRPWSPEKWQAWLEKSNEYRQELERLHQSDDIEARNKFIDDHSSHWGQLKPWLTVLSLGKCWFSEAKEIYTHYEVEHFRPKKEAKALDGTVRDGYWWLAFDYTNFRLCTNVGNRKKGGWFPLCNEVCLSNFDDQCKDIEEPYLLDPTKASDVELIAFDEEGKAIPEFSCTDWEKKRVEQTIERLKLNEHVNLAEERRKVWQRVSREIDGFFNEKSRCGGNPVAKERYENHCRTIRQFANAGAELSAVAKCCALVRGDRLLSRLVGA